jgi:hypothetical protein
MLVDKLSWFKINGNWFAVFGLLNLIGYGASLLMTKEQYRYHFAYANKPPKIFQPIKSFVGSEKLANVIWTAPSLILLNFYMHQRVGSLVMTKFFGLSVAASFIFMSAFNPDSGLNVRPLKRFSPNFDSHAEDGSFYMGADSLAGSLIYFTLFYHRMWYVAMPFMAFDLMYYGPMASGALFAPIAGALMFF